LNFGGLVFLGRLALIPSELDISEPQRSQWSRLNASFIAAAEHLSCVERSLYESQLQEAVRYEIGPKIILGRSDILRLNSTDVQESTLHDLERSLELFKEAAIRRPGAYVKSTICHFWAMVSAGTYADTGARQAVYAALQQVDPEAWRLARFRKDYPLNRFDAPLKAHTEWTYRMMRLLAFGGTSLGFAFTLKKLFSGITGQRRLDADALTWMLLTSCLLAHSLLVGLSIFPDPRYVMANFVIQWTLLALALDWVSGRWGARV
jgi:hypothetical protein